jgi:mono/diheme cytochrome c family protein
MRHVRGIACLSVIAGLAATIVLAPAEPASTSRLKRGEYLVTIMDCAGCHTPGALRGQPDMNRALGGSDIGFQIPDVGTFYPPNLTPDRETGLGTWSEADIIKAVRGGTRPDGRILVPIMPYHSYAKLTDPDARALATYLKSIRAVRHKAPAPAAPSERPSAPYLAVIAP